MSSGGFGGWGFCEPLGTGATSRVNFILLQTGTGIPLTDQGIFAVIYGGFAILGMALMCSFGFTWTVQKSASGERRELHTEISELALRLAVHERSMQMLDRIMESRVLSLFEGANPVTPEEAAHINFVRRSGLDSEQVTEGDLEWAIRILDAEYDAGLVPAHKRADAHLALAFLNAALERRRVRRESQTMQAVSAPQRRSWWSR